MHFASDFQHLVSKCTFLFGLCYSDSMKGREPNTVSSVEMKKGEEWDYYEKRKERPKEKVL